jgi:hypothetical protein
MAADDQKNPKEKQDDDFIFGPLDDDVEAEEAVAESEDGSPDLSKSGIDEPEAVDEPAAIDEPEAIDDEPMAMDDPEAIEDDADAPQTFEEVYEVDDDNMEAPQAIDESESGMDDEPQSIDDPDSSGMELEEVGEATIEARSSETMPEFKLDDEAEEAPQEEMEVADEPEDDRPRTRRLADRTQARQKSGAMGIVMAVVALLVGVGGGGGPVYFWLNGKLNKVTTELDTANNRATQAEQAKTTAETGKASTEIELTAAKESLATKTAVLEKERDDALAGKASALDNVTVFRNRAGQAAVATTKAESELAKNATVLEEALTANISLKKELGDSQTALANETTAKLAAVTEKDAAITKSEAAALAAKNALVAQTNAEKARQVAENKAQAMAARIAQSGPAAGSNQTAIEITNAASESLSGLAKARKKLEVASLFRKDAIRLIESPDKQAEAKQLLNEATTTASEARAIAEEQKDTATLLDALYALGRASEIKSDFDAALKMYTTGRDSASAEIDKSRFSTAIVRTQIAKLRKARKANSTTSATTLQLRDRDGNHFVFFQPATDEFKLLELSVALAKESVAQSKRLSPAAFLSLGTALNEMAAYYARAKQSDKALNAYDDAIIALKDGIRVFKNPAAKIDDLESTLIIRIFDEYGLAHRGRAEISVPEQVKTYKQVADSFKSLETRWSQLATTVAAAVGLEAKIPLDTQRLDAKSNAANTWMGQLAKQVDSVVQERNTGRVALSKLKKEYDTTSSQLKDTTDKLTNTTAMRNQYLAERDRMIVADKTWTATGKDVAKTLGLKAGVNADGQRWTNEAQQNRTRLWLAQLEAQAISVVQTRGLNRREWDRYQNAEKAWVAMANGIAKYVGYKGKLPADNARWTTEGVQTKIWMTDLHDAVQALIPKVQTNNRRESLTHYSQGLENFFAKDYAGAEAELTKAIEGNKRDARFYYFRGLSRHFSGDKSKAQAAVTDMYLGSALERQDSPDDKVVFLALERVQFEQRKWMEPFRPIK